MSNDNLTPLLNYAIHPGEILQDALTEHDLSQKDLADRIGISYKHLNEIVKGKAAISSVQAQKLEFVFGTSSGYWLNLQKNYEEIKARLAIDEQFLVEKKELENFKCYKELAETGFVKKTSIAKEKYQELLHFFAVSSLSLVSKNYQVQFRKSAKDINVDCLAAWLRMGEILYRRAKKPEKFDEKKFADRLVKIRAYTSESIETASQKLIRDCFESGVVLTYTPYLKNTFVNGITRWYPSGTPQIQLTARNARSDIFWFTFFHEAAHLIKHSKRKNYVEWQAQTEKDADELEADAFAANLLIPLKDYSVFVQEADFSPVAVKTFAGNQGIGADIVAGRLAKEGLITWPAAMQYTHKIAVSI